MKGGAEEGIQVQPAQLRFQLFPDLRPDEYEALKADIAKRGILVPVEVDQNGEVLDGHHRLKIARELGIEAPTTQREFADDAERILHVLSLNAKRRHLNSVARGEVLLRAEAELLAIAKEIPTDGNTLTIVSDPVGTAAKAMGVSKSTAYNDIEAAQLPAPLKEAVRTGKKTVATAKREATQTERRNKKPGPLPAGTFRTIVIDPPWDYGDHAVRGAAATHYAVMDMLDLAELPVSDMAGDEAHLYVWVTNPMLPFVWQLIDAWGFEYKTLLTWGKPQMGTGHWFRGATEHVAFCTRGNLPLRSQDIINWFQADRRKHSEKPEEFYEIVERASGGPYVELFARQARQGWEAWGDEL